MAVPVAWRILRPGNCAMAALGTAVGVALATFGAWPTAVYFAVLHAARLEVWIGAPLAAWCVTAAGNVLNDMQDVDVDRVAHPRRPLVTGELALPQAAALATGLGLLGLGLAWWAGGPGLLAFAAANAGLIVLYESAAKQRVLVGNVLVGWLVGSTLLFGGYAWGGVLGLQAAAPLAAMAGLSTLGREVLKDMEDQAADAARRRTVAHAMGQGAWWIAAAAVAAAVAYSAADAWMHDVPPLLWLLAPWSLFAAAIAVAWQAPGKGQRLLKAAMLAALVVYLLPGLVRTLG